MTEKKENYQFRILYFIGIFLIVANHLPNNGSFSLFYEWFPAYSFHLGLFIFASGYFFINNKDKKILIFIKKIINKFLVPLYIWNFIYGIVCLLLNKFGYNLGSGLSLKNLLIMPIYNGHQFAFNLASWFIWPLFVIQLINIFVIKILNKNNYLYLLYFVFCLFLGFFGVQLAINGYNNDYLLLLDKVLYFLPFFFFRYALSYYARKV